MKNILIILSNALKIEKNHLGYLGLDVKSLFNSIERKIMEETFIKRNTKIEYLIINPVYQCQ